MLEKIMERRNRDQPFPWVMLQKWENVLFLHWPISPETLMAYIPEELELDIYDEQAWISIVSFKVSRVRFRYLPRVPYVRPMLQVNIRTYVKKDGEKGVYFFSMDTNKLSAVLGGKFVTAPFFHATMMMKRIEHTFHLYSLRKGMRGGEYNVRFCPVNQAFHPENSSLDYWLLERYIFWTYKSGHLYRADIQHERWKIRRAAIKIENQSLLPFLPEDAVKENPAVGHYAHYKVAQNGMIKKVE